MRCFLALPLLFCACIPTGTSGSATSGSSSSSSSSSSSGAGTIAPSCVLLCAAATDCETATSPADQWTCTSGACRYRGCQSDDECTPGPDAGWTCAPSSGGVRTCTVRCAAKADCDSALGTTPEQACRNGLCWPAGCTTDGDCLNGTVCRPHRAPLGTPDTSLCVQGCTTVGDCPVLGVGHHSACEGGACRDTGCTSDRDCGVDAGAALLCR